MVLAVYYFLCAWTSLGNDADNFIDSVKFKNFNFLNWFSYLFFRLRINFVYEMGDNRGDNIIYLSCCYYPHRTGKFFIKEYFIAIPVNINPR